LSPKEPNPNPQELWQRMVNLEEDAYRDFADLFGRRFRSIFMSRGLPMADAEDLAATCVTDIALKVGRYDPRRGSFGAWVFTLARHALADWWRQHRTSLPFSDRPTPQPPSEEEPEESRSEVVAAVREAMTQIPERDQVLLRMRNLEAVQPYSAIAERLGIRPETARVRHLRALRRLKAILGKDPRVRTLLERHEHRSRRRAS